MESKKEFPIRIAFFKGFAGMVLSMIMFYISFQFVLLGEIGPSNEIIDVMKVFGILGLLGMIGMPWWYWIVYPIMISTLKDYDTSSL